MSDNLSQTRSEYDRMIDEVTFKRDLDEVHLLLDHVSGQTDTSLASLKIADEADPEGKKMLSTRAIVERITQIHYPAGRRYRREKCRGCGVPADGAAGAHGFGRRGGGRAVL